MAALQPGAFVFPQYAGFPLCHERLVLAWIEQGEYVVLTPDGEIYIEQLDAGNVDLDGIRYARAGGGLPFGLAGQQLYRFQQAPSGAELAGVLAEGDIFARAETVARGLAVVGVNGAPAAGNALAPSVKTVRAVRGGRSAPSVDGGWRERRRTQMLVESTCRRVVPTAAADARVCRRKRPRIQASVTARHLLTPTTGTQAFVDAHNRGR